MRPPPPHIMFEPRHLYDAAKLLHEGSEDEAAKQARRIKDPTYGPTYDNIPDEVYPLLRLIAFTTRNKPNKDERYKDRYRRNLEALKVLDTLVIEGQNQLNAPDLLHERICRTWGTLSKDSAYHLLELREGVKLKYVENSADEGQPSQAAPRQLPGEASQAEADTPHPAGHDTQETPQPSDNAMQIPSEGEEYEMLGENGTEFESRLGEL